MKVKAALRWSLDLAVCLQRVDIGYERTPGHRIQMHCCQTMRDQVKLSSECHSTDSLYSDALVAYTPRFDEYGLVIHDGGSSVLLIAFCPWCGANLPSSRRHEWFDQVEALGITDLDTSDLPEKYRSDAWFRDA